MSCVVKPGVPASTRKPCTPSSVCAHTIATSARLPLVIHILLPLRRQPSPSRTARVCIAAGSEPPCASVRPKQPIALPAAIAGNQRCRCAWLP